MKVIEERLKSALLFLSLGCYVTCHQLFLSNAGFGIAADLLHGSLKRYQYSPPELSSSFRLSCYPAFYRLLAVDPSGIFIFA